MGEKILGWEYDNEYYIDGTGKICKRKSEYRENVCGLSEWFKNYCVSLGYTAPEHAFCANIFTKTYFGNMLGKSEKDLMFIVKENGAKRNKHKEKVERFKKEREEYSNIFIAVDTKDIDFYDAGFSVFVLLNTRYNYRQQLSFFKKNKGLLIKYISKKLSEQTRGKAKNANDILPFCYVSDIVLTRSNEVRVTYQVKGENKVVM